jgi:hypothetical protein
MRCSLIQWQLIINNDAQQASSIYSQCRASANSARLMPINVDHHQVNYAFKPTLLTLFKVNYSWKKTLFEEIGRKNTVEFIAIKLYYHIYEDESINQFFKPIDFTKQSTKMTAF